MPRIEIGLSMLYCLGYPFSYMIRQLRNVAVRHVEVLDESYHAFNSRRVKVIKEIAQNRCLNMTAHAPFVDVNIASPNPTFRRVMLKRLKKSMRLASQLDATLWVFHPGLQTGVSHLRLGEDWRLNLQSVRELLDAANENDVEITIENTPEPFPFILKSVDDFVRFYGDLGDANLGLTLDVGHANVNGQISDFIKRFSDKIVHVHASDNDGTFDSHLGIGEGNIDWKKVADSLKNVNYRRVIVVESESGVGKSIETLKEFLSNNAENSVYDKSVFSPL